MPTTCGRNSENEIGAGKDGARRTQFMRILPAGNTDVPQLDFQQRQGDGGNERQQDVHV
ncbi:hypothetical protein [uncultured Sanguibacteroides sp.]|uniref:hypothetical protein n=1 Tax=uncultured Sanguibacteroides sp. TaxID=1635151 RepID=UPI002803CAA3|nr:hypothetical protein [uncultured Sanguibacteroides sp.]